MQGKEIHKEQPPFQGTSRAARPDEDDFRRAENETPRANANIRDKKQEEPAASDTVGSEITDGEDA